MLPATGRLLQVAAPPFAHRSSTSPIARATIGNAITLALPAIVQRNLERWGSLDDQELGSLGGRLREAIGEKRALIEKAAVVHRGGEALVEVRLRYPMDDDERDIEGVLELAAEAWLREHLAAAMGDGGETVSS